MGQADLLAWLEGHPGWHTIQDIALDTGRDYSNVGLLIRKLLRTRDIECKIINGKVKRLYRMINKPRM